MSLAGSQERTFSSKVVQPRLRHLKSIVDLMSGIIGMAGNQVLEWYDLDSEIKTANLANVSVVVVPLVVRTKMINCSSIVGLVVSS